MICATCNHSEVLLGQPCPRCGTVAVLPGDPSGAGYPPAPEPTLTMPVGAAEPTLAFAAPTPAPPMPPAPGVFVPGVPEPMVPPKKSRRGLLVALIGLLAVVLIGGGVAFAGLQFGWFGGAGKQPYEVLPVSAVAYSQLDLNPVAEQKLAAYSFFRELPAFKDAATNPSFDVKEVAWNEWVKSNDANGLNYAADIKPWLGDRLGLAQLLRGANDSEMIYVGAIQVTDERAAAEKLPKVLGDEAGVVTIGNGYAIITQTGDVDAVKTALAAGTMNQNQTFLADLAKLGSTGFVAGWVDLKALAEAGGMSLSSGRATYALRFADNSLEWAGNLVGTSPQDLPASTGGTDLGDLPADTAVAVSLQGGGAWLKANWSRYSGDDFSSLEQLGWILPDDLATVLGSQATVAMPKDGVETLIGWATDPAGGFPMPAVGSKLSTDSPTRVAELVKLSDPTGTLKVRLADGKAVIATTEDYLGRLSDPSAAKLGDSAAFKAVVPDHAKSVYSGYIDLKAFNGLYDQLPAEYGDYGPFLKALTGLGFTVVPNADGASWSSRLARS